MESQPEIDVAIQEVPGIGGESGGGVAGGGGSTDGCFDPPVRARFDNAVAFTPQSLKMGIQMHNQVPIQVVNKLQVKHFGKGKERKE